MTDRSEHHVGAKDRLLGKGYIALLGTQFLGAANDNLLKMVVTFMVIDGAWSGRLGEGGQGFLLFIFTLPFILLSGYAGRFSDRRSKRTVARLVKVLELPIVALAFWGFWIGEDGLWFAVSALVLLACQSALFGPAKYGMIPELVHEQDLSRANGLINMFTNLAVILGTAVAGTISDRYWPQSSQAIALGWLPGVVMGAIAVAGLVAVLFLPRLEPGDPTLRPDYNPLGTYLAALRDMARTPLLLVALTMGWFNLLASMALLIVPEYTIVLQISREHAGMLLGVLGIGIGFGSLGAGLISGNSIRPILVPIGAGCLLACFLALALVPPTFTNVAVFLALAGAGAGFYIVPLQALLQALSPPDERGRFLGTANGLSFTFLGTGALLFWFIRPWYGGPTPDLGDDVPHRIFLVCSALLVVGCLVLFHRMRRMGFRFGDPIHPVESR